MVEKLTMTLSTIHGVAHTFEQGFEVAFQPHKHLCMRDGQDESGTISIYHPCIVECGEMISRYGCFKFFQKCCNYVLCMSNYVAIPGGISNGQVCSTWRRFLRPF